MDHVYSLVYIYFFKTIWDIAWVRMSLYQCTQAVLAEDLTVFKLLWCSLPLILLSFNIISYKQKYFNINLVVFQEAQPVLIIKITEWKGVNMITCLFSCPDEGKKNRSNCSSGLHFIYISSCQLSFLMFKWYYKFNQPVI